MSDVPRADDINKRQGPSFREILSIILMVVVAIFALVNLEEVTVDLIVDDVTMPLVFVIVISALLGFGAGYLFARRRRRARR